MAGMHKILLSKGLRLPVLLLILSISALSASADKVTFKVKVIDDNYELIPIPETPAVGDVLLEADSYFESAECENLFYYWDNYIVFGRDKENSTEGYPVGTLKLTLSPLLRSKIIKSVSVKAEYYNWKNTQLFGVHLFVNGVSSEAFVSAKDIYLTGTLTSEINQKCSELELRPAVLYNSRDYDSRVMVSSVTIEYEDSTNDPLAIDSAIGIDDLNIGQDVTLANCVVERKGEGYVAHVVKTADGQPIISDGQPEVYTLPVVWATEVQTDLYADISGTIAESNGQKVIEIQGMTLTEPELHHFPPTILINGEPLTQNYIIKADDKIEFQHPLGDNVLIYYTKRTTSTLDPTNSQIDPALLTSSNSRIGIPYHVANESDTPDENGTYLYTGPFQLVHKDNLSNTSARDVGLTMQIHSSPTLTAGASWAPSEEHSLSNEITMSLQLLHPDAEHQSLHYYDLQGRPISHPRSGQLLLRHGATPSSTVKIFY